MIYNKLNMALVMANTCYDIDRIVSGPIAQAYKTGQITEKQYKMLLFAAKRL